MCGSKRLKPFHKSIQLSQSLTSFSKGGLLMQHDSKTVTINYCLCPAVKGRCVSSKGFYCISSVVLPSFHSLFINCLFFFLRERKKELNAKCLEIKKQTQATGLSTNAKVHCVVKMSCNVCVFSSIQIILSNTKM